MVAPGADGFNHPKYLEFQMKPQIEKVKQVKIPVSLEDLKKAAFLAALRKRSGTYHIQRKARLKLNRHLGSR